MNSRKRNPNDIEILFVFGTRLVVRTGKEFHVEHGDVTSPAGNTNA